MIDMWMSKTTLLTSALAVMFLTSSDLPQPVPTEKLDKNKEYVCTRWRGSSDPTQNQPSVCIQWEAKEKPLFRRT
jgi:hypothetical protein